MRTENAKDYVSLFKIMAKAELEVAGFYRLCGETVPEDGEFWLSLVNQEESHAKYFVEMYKLLMKHPERFVKGQTFNATIVVDFIDGVKVNAARLRNNELNKKDILIIAHDIEHALIENRIGEILKTKDPEFLALVDAIMSQTHGHRTSIDNKIRIIEAYGG